MLYQFIMTRPVPNVHTHTHVHTNKDEHMCLIGVVIAESVRVWSKEYLEHQAEYVEQCVPDAGHTHTHAETALMSQRFSVNI